MENTFTIKGARILDRELFSHYKNEPVVDLTGSTCHFIPKWLSEYPIKLLIVDANNARFALGFEKGFPENIQVKINGMEDIPDHLSPKQVVGENPSSLALTQEGIY